MNTAEYDDVFVGVKASSTLVNSDYLYWNSTQTIGGKADTTLVDIGLHEKNARLEIELLCDLPFPVWEVKDIMRTGLSYETFHIRMTPEEITENCVK